MPTFFGITICAFAFVRLLPGDPILAMAGEHGVTPERYAQLVIQFGLRQAGLAAVSQLSGPGAARRFRQSRLATKRPVLTEFLTLFPATVELSLCAHRSSPSCWAFPAGIFAAVKRGSWFDQATDGRGAHRLFDADLLVGSPAHHLLLRLSSDGRRFRGASRSPSSSSPITGFMTIDALL